MFTEASQRVDRARAARELDQVGADPGQPQGADRMWPDPEILQQPVLWALQAL